MMAHLVIITSAAKLLKNSFGILPCCKQLTQWRGAAQERTIDNEIFKWTFNLVVGGLSILSFVVAPFWFLSKRIFSLFLVHSDAIFGNVAWQQIHQWQKEWWKGVKTEERINSWSCCLGKASATTTDGLCLFIHLLPRVINSFSRFISVRHCDSRSNFAFSYMMFEVWIAASSTILWLRNMRYSYVLKSTVETSWMQPWRKFVITALDPQINHLCGSMYICT